MPSERDAQGANNCSPRPQIPELRRVLSLSQRLQQSQRGRTKAYLVSHRLEIQSDPSRKIDNVRFLGEKSVIQCVNNRRTLVILISFQ